MKKLLKLKIEIEKRQILVAEKMSDKLVQYWTGGDWQMQGLERAYSTVLRKIEKLIS